MNFIEQIKLISRAGLEGKSDQAGQFKNDHSSSDSLEKRIQCILNIAKKPKISSGQMMYFIMYDIRHNKVRTLISKYLIKKGCQRVQKSIFFMESTRQVYDDILNDLKAVQESYTNEDSIFFVPIQLEQLGRMKILGKNLDFDLITGNKNTLFF